jgi:hypothetical protein
LLILAPVRFQISDWVIREAGVQRQVQRLVKKDYGDEAPAQQKYQTLLARKDVQGMLQTLVKLDKTGMRSYHINSDNSLFPAPSKLQNLSMRLIPNKSSIYARCLPTVPV